MPSPHRHLRTRPDRGIKPASVRCANPPARGVGRDVILLLCGLVAAFVVGGCTVGGSSSVSKENNVLRARVLELEARVLSLTAERDGLLAAVAAEARSGTNGERLTSSDAAGLRSLIPRIASVEIGRLSGLTPTGDKETPTGVVVYFSPFDGAGRFTQLVGKARCEVMSVGEKGKDLIASRDLSAAEVHAAYRSGITGTYYQMEAPLVGAAASAGRGPLTLEISLTVVDELTGLEHKHERRITR